MSKVGGIAAHEELLLNLLWGAAIYRVPLYQRDFAWEQEQTAELWSDVVRTAFGSEVYFLGSMVFVKTDTSVVFEILDGQQRFASLSLMIAALRDLIHEQQPGHDLKNLQDTLTTMDLSGQFGYQETVRLHMNERDDDYFTGIAAKRIIGKR